MVAQPARPKEMISAVGRTTMRASSAPLASATRTSRSCVSLTAVPARLSARPSSRTNACSSRGSGDEPDLLGGVVEAPAAILGHRHDVLDPHAEAVGEVDPRLDREAHPRLERLLLALDHVRRLVRRA